MAAGGRMLVAVSPMLRHGVGSRDLGPEHVTHLAAERLTRH
jgi:hypothetical protein